MGQRPFSPEWLKQAEAIYQGLDAGLTHEDKDAIATLAVHHAGSNQHHFIWDHDAARVRVRGDVRGPRRDRGGVHVPVFLRVGPGGVLVRGRAEPMPRCRRARARAPGGPRRTRWRSSSGRDKAEGVIDAPPEYIAEAERMWEDMEMNRKEDYEGQHERKIREMAKEMHRRQTGRHSEVEILEQIHGSSRQRARLKAMEEARAMALAAENARAEMELFGDDVRAHLLAPAPAPARAHADAPAHAPREPLRLRREPSPQGCSSPTSTRRRMRPRIIRRLRRRLRGASDAYEADEADEAETRRDAGFRGMWSGLMPKWVAPAPAAARGMGPRGEGARSSPGGWPARRRRPGESGAVKDETRRTTNVDTDMTCARCLRLRR